MKSELVDNGSFIFAGIFFIVALIFIYQQTNEFWGSLTAAIITAFLAWISYVLMRWLILALR